MRRAPAQSIGIAIVTAIAQNAARGLASFAIKRKIRIDIMAVMIGENARIPKAESPNIEVLIK